MARLSIHVEPHGAVGIARHYIGDLVYGANDGIITTFAVVAGGAGSVPLVPYVLSAFREQEFTWSIVATLTSLFAVGAARTMVTVDRWWTAGLEMLGLGAVVAATADGAGAVIAAAVS